MTSNPRQQTCLFFFIPPNVTACSPLDFVLVSYFWFSRSDVICDQLQFTHTEKCNLFVNELAESFALIINPAWAGIPAI